MPAARPGGERGRIKMRRPAPPHQSKSKRNPDRSARPTARPAGQRARCISGRVVERLPVYWRFLRELDDFGIERVSSAELARRIGITASQLRQDLSHFGHLGQYGYGYPVRELLQAVSALLGLDKMRTFVVVGVGRLGAAIANYPNFGRRNIRLVGLFDTDPAKIGAVLKGVPIRPVAELPAFLTSHKTDVGVICTPPAAAQEVAGILEAGGVQGIWNFAPVRLRTGPDVVVEHLHLGDSLLKLLYGIRKREGEK